MAIALDAQLPPEPVFEAGIRRAPKRLAQLSQADTELALRNALRYIHPDLHAKMAPEFLAELQTHGRIYGYRYRPQGRLKGLPLDQYRGRCLAGKALQLMIDNNLDFDVALYPYELVTYGETGQVFQNWMQYRLTKLYLEQLTEEQTLVLYSGHPLGVFPTRPEAPRVITTNGLMVGAFDQPESFARAAAIGVANYGQMTAGGWMYIGPQGIVHGTYNTLVIAGRLKLGLAADSDLAGKLFVTSGLGGMSGAQGKAAMIAQAAAIIAEVDASRIATRKNQGWISHVTQDAEEAFRLARSAQEAKQGIAIAFHGNIIKLLEYAVQAAIKIDLLSDQTSCHAVYEGGYCPENLSFAERTELLSRDKAAFKRLVDASLQKHFELIAKLSENGAYFFDYGNAFMKSVFDAGVKAIAKNAEDESEGFIWPSYVEDLLGPELFDYGYGPFRWVCLSGQEIDLERTDAAAAETIEQLRPELRYQDLDNLRWVRSAKSYQLVVGTKARILYQDAEGRRQIARRFNAMVRAGEIGPIMLGRDHHDTGGTDSPYRETANIKDGSNIMADMATQIFAGNAARGMTLCALHNGGGVGIGKSINGGFGLLLDGSERVDHIIDSALPWDVMGGVARRSWAGNAHSIETTAAFNAEGRGLLTLPFLADPILIKKLVPAANQSARKPTQEGPALRPTQDFAHRHLASFQAVLKARRAIRLYSGEPIPESVMREALSEATLAPSSSNLQSYEFYWVRDPIKKKLLAEACMGQAAAKTASELVVVAARGDLWQSSLQKLLGLLRQNSKELPEKTRAYYEDLLPKLMRTDPFGVLNCLRRIGFSLVGLRKAIIRGPFSRADHRIYGHIQASLAAETLMLSLAAHGYDSCPMGGFDAVRVKNLLKLGSKAEVTMVVSAGRRQETAIVDPRVRFPYADLVKEI